MKNAEWMIKNGYKFSDVGYCFVGDDNAVNFFLNGEIVGKASCKSYLEAFQKWLDMEHEPILDEAEKQYLSTVIRPFRDRVEYIAKVNADGKGCCYTDCYIFIRFTDSSNDMSFPIFCENDMYKGMKLYDKYTLEELGL